MSRRAAGVLMSAVLFVLVGASPAFARADQTITITCVPTGFTIVVDASALDGQNTANQVYNAVNPFGEVCTVHP